LFSFTLESLSGSIALITSIIGLFPQVYKSYKTKSTADVSMVMLVNYLICCVAWFIYGICTFSSFVIYSNIVGTILAAVSVIQKVIYDKYYGKSV